MQTLQAKLAKLDRKLADPALYDEAPGKARNYARLRGELAKELEQAEEDWLAASEAYERASNGDEVTSSA